MEREKTFTEIFGENPILVIRALGCFITISIAIFLILFSTSLIEPMSTKRMVIGTLVLSGLLLFLTTKMSYKGFGDHSCQHYGGFKPCRFACNHESVFDYDRLVLVYSIMNPFYCYFWFIPKIGVSVFKSIPSWRLSKILNGFAITRKSFKTLME